ncbi:hypothetical protein [Halorientalis persicus]|nr:hypothetical protein [Halorientalis persicus]
MPDSRFRATSTRGAADGLGGVFRTHPSTEKRIEQLERLVGMADGE